MKKEQDAAFTFARHVVNTGFDNIPAEAVDIAKKDILDTLGTIIAGSTALAAKEVVEISREWGGKAESTILAFGDRVPAHMAAFANGTMAHALEYDDTHDKAVLHAGVSVIPSSLAMAERLGKVSGKTIITAVALGIDMMCRMGLATDNPPWTSGWLLTPTYGYFGATAAASKILGLGESQIVNAFGIAYAQTAGNQQVNMDGESALTKRMQAGFAAKGGVMSAVLAQKGLTGAQKSLEGRFGLFNLYQRGEYNPEVLTEGLGSQYEIVNLSFKPYPCCRDNHTYIDAALQLMRDYAITPEDIAEITLIVNEEPHFLCHPIEAMRRPGGVVQAQFSLPYTVALAVRHGNVVLEDFTPQAIKDEKVLEITQKVNAKYDPTIPTRIVAPAVVEMRLKDGRKLISDRVDHAKGHPQNPMSMDDITEKFRNCASHAAIFLPEEKVDKAIDSIKNLEEVTDMGEITGLLTGA
ncbi:MmgE/PrpD family protein [Chloroflexota bacterium]